MAKYVYKLLSGKHAMGSKPTKTGKKSPSKIYNKGDLIYTDTDLHKAFGPSSTSKFELCVQTPVVPAAPVAVAEVEEIDDTYEEVSDEDVVDVEDHEDDDGLMELTVNALKAYAKEQGIDLGHAKKKADVVEAIRDELVCRDEDS